MNTRGSRSMALALVAVVACAATAAAQGTAPLEATLILKNPTPGIIYDPTSATTPLTLVLQLKNVSGAAVLTAAGFSETEFWRRLYFTDPQGGVIIDAAEAAIHTDRRVFFCHSRQRVLLRPTTAPVVPVEVLNGPTDPPQEGSPFFLEFTIDDARKFFDLRRPGRYTANARIPLLTFSSATGNPAIITDCDQLEGQTLVHVGDVTGRQAFTIVSNSVEFVIAAPLTFGGFTRPLREDSTCANPTQNPCLSVREGQILPVKFKLFDSRGAVVRDADARISLVRLGGGAAPVLGTDRFRFDESDQQYIYNLRTRGLSTGVWRIDVTINQAMVRSVHIRIR